MASTSTASSKFESHNAARDVLYIVDPSWSQKTASLLFFLMSVSFLAYALLSSSVGSFAFFCFFFVISMFSLVKIGLMKPSHPSLANEIDFCVFYEFLSLKAVIRNINISKDDDFLVEPRRFRQQSLPTAWKISVGNKHPKKIALVRSLAKKDEVVSYLDEIKINKFSDTQ